MPAERQRRTLDAPSEQPVTEIVVKTPQPIEVDSVLIHPDDLHDFLLGRRRDAPQRSLGPPTPADRPAAHPLDARLLEDARAGRIRTATD